MKLNTRTDYVLVCFSVLKKSCCLRLSVTSWRQRKNQDVVLPAEGVYHQEVADHAGDADGEDDGADGVVGVVGHVDSGVGVRGLVRHRHLQDETGSDKCDEAAGRSRSHTSQSFLFKQQRL